MHFFQFFTRQSTYSTLQADKSFKPLAIILSEISHLQNNTHLQNGVVQIF